MKRSSLLTVLWVLSGCLLAWALLWQGEMIGGIKYFVHVGMGPSAFLQLGLIVGSFSMALASLYSPSTARPLASVMAIGASLFTMCFVAVPLPYFIAVALGYFSPRLFPYSNAGVLLPLLVAVLALWTRAKYAPLETQKANGLRIKQLIPKRATAYFLCATLTAMPILYGLLGAALALLNVQVPYPFFLSFLFSFNPLVPKMLLSIVPEPLDMVMRYAIIFLCHEHPTTS